MEIQNPQWKEFFQQERTKSYWTDLEFFVEKEYQQKEIFPSRQNLFSIFENIDPKKIKVVIIGQDPYHGFNQANGIAFSATNNVKTPRSLLNIFKELKSDLGIDHFNNNDLSGWVSQGVFLCNTILTVESSKPLSHANCGWELFTKNCFEYLNQVNSQIVYLLLGNKAKQVYESLSIKSKAKTIIVGHPSPFSFEKFFKDTKPFSKLNKQLVKLNIEPIDWSK
ncbi:uracil-DNA glycosylase [Williamsoniiplasma somnilux]|uniref:Uracil-DNA glycosylase n=1 Tax=Williamsoniiplasma somnilux TaxID=215578 RepID=A0A2K8NZ60_9MOLU|nr:uracil-DNA glycosylase [Williamsoniiplasma somnilux]ATZ19077.1 uracil-DNA glycosylase [Williamsoniiplasma somnilux]